MDVQFPNAWYAAVQKSAITATTAGELNDVCVKRIPVTPLIGSFCHDVPNPPVQP